MFLSKLRRRLFINSPKRYPFWLSYEPKLIPPPRLLKSEGPAILEEWFRWAEEWSMILRVYGQVTRSGKLLEIGCGLGRIAFPLRYILSSEGTYDGFEICKPKVEFLNKNFHPAHPNFTFIWADINNTYYNPQGTVKAKDFAFPYPDNSFDIVFAASVFTHMLPDTAEHYFKETARVLKPGGRAVFSFFLLDFYRPGQPRPLHFAKPEFSFDHSYDPYGDQFAIAVPDNPELMTAYKLQMIEQFIQQSQLTLSQAPIPGIWSGSSETWVSAQDLVVLKKPE